MRSSLGRLMKKWLEAMSDEKKEPLHPETNFLPPLKMFLAFFDRESRQNKKKKNAEKQEDSDEKKVEKLIEKLSEKEK
jgi:hypothetical protein